MQLLHGNSLQLPVLLSKLARHRRSCLRAACLGPAGAGWARALERETPSSILGRRQDVGNRVKLRGASRSRAPTQELESGRRSQPRMPTNGRQWIPAAGVMGHWRLRRVIGRGSGVIGSLVIGKRPASGDRQWVRNPFTVIPQDGGVLEQWDEWRNATRGREARRGPATNSHEAESFCIS